MALLLKYIRTGLLPLQTAGLLFAAPEKSLVKKFLWVILLSYVSVGGGEANLITNGSFEIGPDAGTWWISLGAGSTDIIGWEVTDGGIDYQGTIWQASDGRSEEHTSELQSLRHL